MTDERSSNVRATDGGMVDFFPQRRRIELQPELLQPLDYLFGSLSSPLLLCIGQVGQGRFSRVDEEAEEVDFPISEAGGKLDSRYYFYRHLGGRCKRLCDTGHGVVVGNGERLQVGLAGCPHQLCGVQLTIGKVGVAVKVGSPTLGLRSWFHGWRRVGVR